jgi:hypothetical protein
MAVQKAGSLRKKTECNADLERYRFEKETEEQTYQF